MMIRPMEARDADGVLAMMRVFYASPAVLHKASEEIFRRDIADCVGDCPYIEGYVFEENGALAGYAMTANGYSTEYGGVCVWVEDLYILPSFRGRGISKMFFEALEKRRTDAVRIRLEAEKENARALKVYAADGFSPSEYIVMDKVPKRG